MIAFLSLSGCSFLLFHPLKELSQNPLVKAYHPDDIYFKTPDGLTLHGWFFRGEGTQHQTILFLHGNAENISTHIHSVLWLVKEGFNLFIFDYRGFGLSEGKPTVTGVHLDAEAALQTILKLPEVENSGIIVLGQSIGGAIAIYMAAASPYKNRIKLLVIDSAFSSYRLIAKEKFAQFFMTWPFQYPLSYLFSDDYSPIRWIKKIAPIPLLFLHGEDDPVVPLHHSRILFDAALDPKILWISGVPGHIASFSEERVRREFVEYIDTALKVQKEEAFSN